MNAKDEAYINALVGTTQYHHTDYDGDGYPDLFDCDPFDPTKDGLIGEAWARMTGAAARAERAARRVYAPTTARARVTAARATARVRAAAAAAAERVIARRRVGVERAAAIRERIRREPPKPRVDIAKEYKRLERRVAERIPTIREIAVVGERVGERPAVERAYREIGERVLGLPKPVKAVGVETFKFTRGAYKEFQQYPVTTAAKIAAFYYAGPAIRGVGVAARAARAAAAARAPLVARIPTIGPAAVRAAEKAGLVGEKAAKYAMPAIGALWAVSVGKRVYETPAEWRAREAGRIFAAEVVPMAAGAAIAQEAAMFRQLGIPRWKPPSIKRVKEWKPPEVKRPPTPAELPPTLRPPKAERPPAIEPIAIPPKPGVPRKIQLRDELIELEAKPPKGSALFGAPAEKAAWVKYNQKIASIKGRIKSIEAKEAKAAREREAVEAEKWEAAEAKEWLEIGMPAVVKPAPPTPLSPKIRLRNQLIELEATPPRGSRLYGTSAQKKAWKEYDTKVASTRRKIKEIEAKEATEAAKTREKELAEAEKWKEAEVAFAETVVAPKPVEVTVRKVKREPPVRKPKEKTLEDEWKEAEASYKEQFEAPTPVAVEVKKPLKPKDVFEEAKKVSAVRIKKRLAEEKEMKEKFGEVAMGGPPGRPQLLLRQELKQVQKTKLKQEQKLVQKQKQAVKQKVKQEQKQEQKYKFITAGEQMTKTMQAAEIQRQKQLAEMAKPIALQKQKQEQVIVPFVGYKPLYDVPQVPREVAIPKVTHVPRVDEAQKYRVPPPPQILKVPPPPPPVTRRPPPPPPRVTEPPPPPPFIPFMMDDGIGGAAAVRARRKRAWKLKHELITLEDFLGYKL